MEREPIWDDPEDHAEWQMMMYHSDQPEGVMMTALKEYAEPYDWVVDQLKDWACRSDAQRCPRERPLVPGNCADMNPLLLPPERALWS